MPATCVLSSLVLSKHKSCDDDATLTKAQRGSGVTWKTGVFARSCEHDDEQTRYLLFY